MRGVYVEMGSAVVIAVVIVVTQQASAFVEEGNLAFHIVVFGRVIAKTFPAKNRTISVKFIGKASFVSIALATNNAKHTIHAYMVVE